MEVFYREPRSRITQTSDFRIRAILNATSSRKCAPMFGQCTCVQLLSCMCVGVCVSVCECRCKRRLERLYTRTYICAYVGIHTSRIIGVISFLPSFLPSGPSVKIRSRTHTSRTDTGSEKGPRPQRVTFTSIRVHTEGRAIALSTVGRGGGGCLIHDRITKISLQARVNRSCSQTRARALMYVRVRIRFRILLTKLAGTTHMFDAIIHFTNSPKTGTRQIKSVNKYIYVYNICVYICVCVRVYRYIYAWQ